MTRVRDTGAYTAASAGELALVLDEAQYEKGHGPCLDAAAGLTILRVRREVSRSSNRKVHDVAAALVARAGRSAGASPATARQWQ